MIDPGLDAHMRAFVLDQRGESLRWQQREVEARVAFRRACALEVRYARSLGPGPRAASSWCNAGWHALNAGRVGAAALCLERGMKALEDDGAGHHADDAFDEFREALAEAQAGQVRG